MGAELRFISHAYRTDAAHLLNKAQTAYEYSPIRTRQSFQAKIVVDLYMSIECALKSLMCSKDTTRNAEETLRDIFKHGHDLKRLLKKTRPKSVNDEDTNVLRQLNKKGVSLRYNLDLYSLVTNELLTSDNVQYQITPNLLNDLIRIAGHLSTEANNLHKEVFSDTQFGMTSDNMEHEIKEFRKLLKRSRKNKNKEFCKLLKRSRTKKIGTPNQRVDLTR